MKGYDVFIELGDNSKIDLIAVSSDYDLIKIQVKSYMSKNGSVEISPIKTGPGYKFRYSARHADVYALYVIDEDIVLYISAKELLSKKKSLTIRMTRSKNGQVKGTNSYADYLSLERVLRGHTQDA